MEKRKFTDILNADLDILHLGLSRSTEVINKTLGNMINH